MVSASVIDFSMGVAQRANGDYIVTAWGLPARIGLDNHPDLHKEITDALSDDPSLLVHEPVPPAPTQAELEARARDARNAAIEAIRWRVERYRDQLDAGATTTDSAEVYAEMLAYRQALRDWPEAMGFPDPETMPQLSDFLKE